MSLLLNTPVLAIEGLQVAAGEGRDARPVLDGLQWSVQAGQVVGLLGLRGAQAGRVQPFGRPLSALDDGLRARIGYVPQHSELFEWLTARQLLAYFCSFYRAGTPPRSKA
jgi:ABC-2 type transport system ATP-binding protein